MAYKYFAISWDQRQFLHIFSIKTITSIFAGLSLVAIIYISIARNYIESQVLIPSFKAENSDALERDYQLRQFNTSVPHGSITNKTINQEKTPCKFAAKNLKNNVTVSERFGLVNSNPDILHKVIPGGSFRPTTCHYEQHVAIIVPFRDREEHLKLFLHHMHSFLQAQLVTYTIFVIEQEAGELFNRGLLFNVGFLMALTKGNYTCFILHDVDLLPTNENNRYECTSKVIHMRSSAMKHYYPTYFGGVLSISSALYKAVNGFSNLFYGWGQEDDDFFRRIVQLKVPYYRHPEDVGCYESLSHKAFSGHPKQPLLDRLKIVTVMLIRLFVLDNVGTYTLKSVQTNMIMNTNTKWPFM